MIVRSRGHRVALIAQGIDDDDEVESDDKRNCEPKAEGHAEVHADE